MTNPVPKPPRADAVPAARYRPGEPVTLPAIAVAAEISVRTAQKVRK